MLSTEIRIDRNSIRTAYDAIRPYVRRTPVLEIDGAELGLPPCTIVFKLEYLQHSGSFKARGAFANVLLREIPKAGVVAASGGNHGVAVAYAAMTRKVPATIFVPVVASPAKRERIEAFGARLVVGGDLYEDARIASLAFEKESGAMPIHPFDHPVTLLGAATAGLEMSEQSRIDSLLVSVGGGGLISGIASWYEGEIDVIGVEPELSPTLSYALKAGHPVDAPGGGIAADSLAPRRIGELNFPIVQKYTRGVRIVTDEAIRNAQETLWRVLRIVTEPGGATALAALLSGKYVPRRGERIGVLLCGANTTAVEFK